MARRYINNHEEFGQPITNLGDLTFGSILLDSSGHMLLYSASGLTQLYDTHGYMHTETELSYDGEYTYVGNANKLFSLLEEALVEKLKKHNE